MFSESLHLIPDLAIEQQHFYMHNTSWFLLSFASVRVILSTWATPLDRTGCLWETAWLKHALSTLLIYRCHGFTEINTDMIQDTLSHSKLTIRGVNKCTYDNDNDNEWFYCHDFISIQYIKQHTCNQYNIFTCRGSKYNAQCSEKKMVAFLHYNEDRKPWLMGPNGCM